MKLFFDTETTGKANMRGGPMVTQPAIVQLGALLTDDDGGERAVMNLIIKPDGWTIPAEAAAIHGITTDLAEQCGVPLVSALSVFSMLCARANELIAHNIDFDLLVTESAYHRLGKESRFDGLPKFCTMKATTDVCKIPGPYGYKWPKLAEAHVQLLCRELEDAHDALADVRGCARVYFALKAMQQPVEAVA